MSRTTRASDAHFVRQSPPIFATRPIKPFTIADLRSLLHDADQRAVPDHALALVVRHGDREVENWDGHEWASVAGVGFMWGENHDGG